MKTTKVLNLLVALALVNFASAKSLRSTKYKFNKRFWAGPDFVPIKDDISNNNDDGEAKVNKCSTKITDQGYDCCSSSCITIFSDKDGDWAIENGKWCGCGDNNADDNVSNVKLSKCSSKITDKGYKCCPLDCRVVYTDDDGTWGLNNNYWCGCNPENDIAYMKNWLNEYNKRVEEILADDKEIEKKWLIEKEKVPYDLEAPTVDQMDIKQTYISFDPEIRVREYTYPNQLKKYYEMTIKTNLTDDGLIRDEVNIDINEKQYENLLKKQEGNTIYKTRYQLLYKNDVIAIDIFHDDLEGLAYMEVEFSNTKESDAFKTPDWVIKDVTDDIRYKNGHLARYGIPSLEK